MIGFVVFGTLDCSLGQCIGTLHHRKSRCSEAPASDGVGKDLSGTRVSIGDLLQHCLQDCES